MPKSKRVRWNDIAPISDADLARVREAASIDLLEYGAGEEDRLALAKWLVGMIKRIEIAEGTNAEA